MKTHYKKQSTDSYSELRVARIWWRQLTLGTKTLKKYLFVYIGLELCVYCADNLYNELTPIWCNNMQELVCYSFLADNDIILILTLIST